MIQMADNLVQTRIVFRFSQRATCSSPCPNCVRKSSAIDDRNDNLPGGVLRDPLSRAGLHHIAMQDLRRLFILLTRPRAWIFCSSRPSAIAKPYSVAQALAGSQGYKHPLERFYPYPPHAVEIVEDPAAVTAGTVRIQIFGSGADCHARSAGDRIAG